LGRDLKSAPTRGKWAPLDADRNLRFTTRSALPILRSQFGDRAACVSQFGMRPCVDDEFLREQAMSPVATTSEAVSCSGKTAVAPRFSSKVRQQECRFPIIPSILSRAISARHVGVVATRSARAGLLEIRKRFLHSLFRVVNPAANSRSARPTPVSRDRHAVGSRLGVRFHGPATVPHVLMAIWRGIFRAGNPPGSPALIRGTSSGVRPAKYAFQAYLFAMGQTALLREPR
jgi:hypothetical protein